MQREEREIIENIIYMDGMIDGLQNKIEREQEQVIGDLAMPAMKAVNKLIELDNRRVDLCNLRVLYAFIKRGLGDEINIVDSDLAIKLGSDSYSKAKRQVELAGYSLDRVKSEFGYLFKLIKRRRGVRRMLLPDVTVPLNVHG